MWEIVKGLMTSLLASQWPLVAGAILCVTVGWLLRDGVEKIMNMIRKGKKNNNAISRTKMYQIENENEDSENRSTVESNKENELEEILERAARDIEENKGNVFELKEIWIDAIEPIVNISMDLRTKIQDSGIFCSALIEAKGINKEGKEWFFCIIDDDIGDKEILNGILERENMSNEIVQIIIEIKLYLTFAKMEKKKMLSIKGMFHKPGERITGKWKDNRYIMHVHGETEQPSRRGYDREGVYEML